MKNQNVAKTIQKQNISCKLNLSLLSQLMIKLNSIKNSKIRSARSLLLLLLKLLNKDQQLVRGPYSTGYVSPHNWLNKTRQSENIERKRFQRQQQFSLVVWGTRVAGSKWQNEKIEISSFKNFRVLKKAFYTPKV